MLKTVSRKDGSLAVLRHRVAAIKALMVLLTVNQKVDVVSTFDTRKTGLFVVWCM